MKLSLEELKVAVTAFVDSAKIAITSFSVTRDNIVGLVDKIGKIVSLDTAFYDKLPELDGDNLTEGKTIEEWYQDLILADDYNADLDGSRALKFYSPTFRPASYSVTLGKKVIAESIPNNNIERAVNNQDQFLSIVASMTKRLSDSRDAWKYQCKRQILGVICDKVVTAYSGATAYVDATTDIVEGKFYKQGTPTEVAVCVKSRVHTAADTWASLIASGYVVVIHMKKVLPVPVDTATGEAFIKAIKESVEKAQDISEGYSLNGNTIGAEIGLSLYVSQGVMPSLEVDTMAGAFNLEKLGMGVEAKVIKDFGSTTSNAYAILMDSRGARLHNDYEAVRENQNGAGDFLNLFHHMEFTGFASRNTFITIFVSA